MKKWILACALSIATMGALIAPSATFAAEPSVNDIEAAVARGDLSQAQTMIDQVVAAHPGSARAHYFDAQILERNHRYADALAQLDAARNIDPSIGFTQKKRFESVQQRIASEAAHAQRPVDHSAALTSTTTASPSDASMQSSPASDHSPSGLAWLALLIVIAAVIALLAWGMRRRRKQDDAGGVEIHREQLRQATVLLDAVRAAKLDLKLSSSPDRGSWIAEAESIEAELRDLIDALSSTEESNRFGHAPQASPAYALESLEPRVARIKALAEGRPDPALHDGDANRSAYANEANRLAGQQTFGQAPGTWQQAPQQVIVQQPSSGSGVAAGVGGLLGGVLLGEMLSGNRERDVIVERDVPVRAPQQDLSQNDNNSFDFGNGGNSWDDGSQMDAGNDSSNDWDDNS